MELKSLNGKISLATKQLLYAEVAGEAERIFESLKTSVEQKKEPEWSDIARECNVSGQHLVLFELMIAIQNIRPMELDLLSRENPA